MANNFFRLTILIIVVGCLISACAVDKKINTYTRNNSVFNPVKVSESTSDSNKWAIAYRTTYSDMNALFPRLGPVTPTQMEAHVQSFSLFVDFINTEGLSHNNIQHNRTMAANMIAEAINTRQDICLFITDEKHTEKGTYRMFRFKYNCSGRFDIILETETSLPVQMYADKNFNIRLIKN